MVYLLIGNGHKRAPRLHRRLDTQYHSLFQLGNGQSLKYKGQGRAGSNSSKEEEKMKGSMGYYYGDYGEA